MPAVGPRTGPWTRPGGRSCRGSWVRSWASSAARGRARRRSGGRERRVPTASATPSPPPACCVAWSSHGRRRASAEWQECGKHTGAAGGSPWLPPGPASWGPLHCAPAQIPVRGLGKALFPWTCAWPQTAPRASQLLAMGKEPPQLRSRAGAPSQGPPRFASCVVMRSASGFGVIGTYTPEPNKVSCTARSGLASFRFRFPAAAMVCRASQERGVGRFWSCGQVGGKMASLRNFLPTPREEPRGRGGLV